MKGATQCFYYIALHYRRSILDEPSVALSPSDVSVDPIDVDEVGERLFCVCSGKKKFELHCTMYVQKFRNKFFYIQDVSYLRNGAKWKRVSY